MYRSLTILIALALLVTTSLAQETTNTSPAKASDSTTAAKEEPKPDPKIADYEKAIKDLKRVDGPFPLYERKRDVLLELSEAQLGKLWHLQATANTGIDPFILSAGAPLGTSGIETFRWDRREDQIWLVRPILKRRWAKDDPHAIAAQRGFPEAILGQYRIEQEHPGKKLLLVNVSTLFNGEVLRLMDMVNIAGGGGFSLDRDKTFVESIKGFPENTVVRMRMHYQNRGGLGENPLAALFAFLGGGNNLEDSRSAPFGVTYNLWYREESDYMPRLADPRVGYFTQDFFDFGKLQEIDRTERYIVRFDLRKKDPRAERSEPVKPIVWTIDHSVPKEYREAVRDGILMWNRAFDAAGFVNAIQVVDAPENDADYDHADGRRNVVRWIASENAGYAVALFRSDPLTGEVLNAAVNVDANFPANVGTEYDMLIRSAADVRQTALAALLRPSDPAKSDRVNRDLRSACGHDHFTPRLEAFFQGAAKLGWQWRQQCQHGPGLRERAAFAWQVLQAGGSGPRISKKEYVEQLVRELVAHEVGHCLGLRHNFVASTNLTTAQYADDAVIRQQGLTASVMEYTPVNMQAVLRGTGYFFNPVVGPYDVWAIRYGYASTTGSTPEAERSFLNSIARESGKPGHAYMTDDDADTFNPYVVRWDGGKDPLKMLEVNFKAYRRVREHAVRNLPRIGQSYADRNRLILMSLRRTLTDGMSAASFVGGLVNNRSFRGDIGERPTLTPVDADTQREAMRLIARHCLSVTAVAVPDAVLNSMSLDFAGDGASGWQAPIRRLITNFQSMLTAQLMSSETTDRIAENAFKTATRSDAYSMTEHYGILLGAVFSEVGTGQSVAPVRRDLQRFVVDGLILQASANPGAVIDDVRSTTNAALGRLLGRFKTALAKGGFDDQTRDHLISLRDSVERFQDREMVTAR